MDRDRLTYIVRTVLDSLRIGRTLPDIRHLCPDPDMPDTQEKQTEEIQPITQLLNNSQTMVSENSLRAEEDARKTVFRFIGHDTL